MIALILAGSVLLAGCMAQTGPGPAGTTGPTTASPVTGTTSLSPQLGELVAFVEEAAAHARTNGRASSIASFNDPNGSWTRKELYIFAYDMNGTALALPFQPELIGVNRSDAADIQGTKYIQAAIAAARNGSGFYELYYPNPADFYAVEPKRCYVVGMGDWFLGSGYYTARLAANATNLSTREGLATFVEQAAAHARTVGKERALADFNDRAGPFASGEVYVYALDYNGVALALPFQPEKVGTSFIDSVDSTGQYYTRVEIDLARRGGGFVYYDYPNPAHGMAVEPKMSYVRDVDGTYWIGAGTYLPVVNATARG